MEQHRHRTEKTPSLQEQFNTWANAVIRLLQTAPPSPLRTAYLTALQRDQREKVLQQAFLLRLGAQLPDTPETAVARHAVRMLWPHEEGRP